jgi:hypothetical protein
VRSEAIRAVITRMAEAGVDLPEPTIRLRRSPASGQPAVAAEPPAAPSMETTRDQSLDELLDREREGQRGLLDAPAGRE